ncbi:hydrogenase maturation nickel metallochaperone HypA [Arcicella aquatica]|uniref:Hydrogenase maturation factor HypA n=1 Tax=Arcicella aquatica TaxID=217141 RepID=A0ABU5QLR3_9BACT|nr:hydrogenase maturation nickel metallochaperone HypA [Arcicella aquatica]MEA5257973.1 hydrogenase maturation nickel metallochaperone HypA [Arcicella aquatica]
MLLISRIKMHEISLVRNIFRTLEEEFPKDIPRIRTINLTVGLLSNVQPILMQNAFKVVIEDEPQYNQMCLNVIVLPILIHCDDCGKTSEVEKYRFVCPCGKPSRNVIQGEELLISSVEFDDVENNIK